MRFKWICIVAFTCASLAAAELDGIWGVTLEGFFPGQSKSGERKRINCYLVRRDGQWVTALATPTNNGKPVWNTALLPIDFKDIKLADKKLSGSLRVTLVPDPWVPSDRKVRTATIEIDATAGASDDQNALAKLSGNWKATIPGAEIELAEARLQGSGSGEIIGAVKRYTPDDLADASYDLAMYDLIPGTTKDNFQRRRSLSIGVKAGKVVSARLGQMDMRHNAYDYEIIDTPEDMRVTPDEIHGSVAFTTDTLDGQRAQMTLALDGVRVSNFMTGAWKGSFTTDDGKKQDFAGYFRGDVRKNAFVSNVVKDDRPWFVPVANFKPVQPGEHPRLFFRKDDVPELRRRAATPDGQLIVKRLRLLLNGSDGESMPASYNPAKIAYDKNGFKEKVGTYTISHAAGFGFLYQLTGNKKYADLARQCIEKAWEGQRNGDDRYAWVAPGGELRAGPSLGWYAVAYDLCYDGWDDDFRRKCTLAIQNYSDEKGGEWNNPEGITLRKMILTPRQGPSSNHYGAVVGGCGLAVLAVKDDPGTDKALLDKYLEVCERNAIRNMSAGFGDGGYFKEGAGPGMIGTQGAFQCFIQALRVAAGHDYANGPRTNASMMALVRMMECVGPPAVYPYRSNMGGTYGSPEFYKDRAGFSHGGQFSEGFGAIADKYKPAFLWFFNHTVEPDSVSRTFDTPSFYPHRPILALINWPTFSGIEEKNPAEVMPKVTRDSLYDYFIFRNRWQDKEDIVTTVLINQPDGTKPRDVMVWGLGERLVFGEPPRKVRVTHFQQGKDGSGTISAGDWTFAVDYSGASGADALIVCAGNSVKREDKARSRYTVVTAGKNKFNVLTLSSKGEHPEPKADGDQIVVGGQKITLSNGALTLEKFNP